MFKALVVNNTVGSDFDTLFGFVNGDVWYDADSLTIEEMESDDDSTTSHVLFGESREHVGTITEYSNQFGRHVSTEIRANRENGIEEIKRNDPNALTQREEKRTRSALDYKK